MVEYAASEFEMGLAADLDVGRYGDGWYVNEVGLRSIELSAFSMDRFEVSTTEFASFLTHACGRACFDERMPIAVTADGYVAMDGYGEQPAVWVDHRSANWFCRWAGKRLPTEAEWEYASGGVNKRPWPWGDESGPKCSFAPFAYDGGRCVSGAQPRGREAAGMTPDGVSDLGGNVSEWVADWYAAYPSDSAIDPKGPDTGTQKVVRGGSFLTTRLQFRPQSRRGFPQSIRSVDLGFRCAWSPDVSDPPGVIRGQLTPAEPAITPKALVSYDTQFQVVLSGLDAPTAVHREGGWTYVSDRHGVTVIDDAGTSSHLEGLSVDKWLSDGVNAHGLDLTNGRLLAFNGPDFEPVLEAADLSMATHHADGWIWTDGTIINRRRADGSDQQIVADQVGISHLHVHGGDLAWIASSNAGSTLAQTALDETLETTVLVTPEQVPNPLKMSAVRFVDSSTLALFVGFDGWPYSGLLCRFILATSTLRCLSHSPPKPSDIHQVDGRFLWMTQYGITTLADGTLGFIGDSLSPGGLHVGESEILVTDRVGGRLLTLPR